VENLFKIVASFELARNSKHPTIKQDIIEECLSPQVAKDLSLRPLGFDMRKLPKAAIFGHLGYTGTILWWSYELDRVLIVLCNRVHPSSLESRMPKLRESLIESAFPDLF
jgi:CubicO group peptidase (beta-lactamase class C family)